MMHMKEVSYLLIGVVALLLGALSYLILQYRSAPTEMAIIINEEAGWSANSSNSMRSATGEGKPLDARFGFQEWRKSEYKKWLSGISEDEMVWYDIPELGIRFKVKKEYAEDFIYLYVTSTPPESSEDFEGVFFYSKSLNDKSGCGDTLGSIRKFKERSDVSTPNHNIKLLGGIYFGDAFTAEYSDGPNTCYPLSAYYDDFITRCRELMNSYLTYVERSE